VAPLLRGGGQSSGFRPNGRDAGGEGFILTPEGDAAQHRQLQYQFRPLERSRRKTYEELRAEEQAPAYRAPPQHRPPTPMPYTPGYDGYGGYGGYSGYGGYAPYGTPPL
jgi:hypothetical protein